MGLETFDVLAYLEHKGIPYATSGENVSQGWIGIQCPFCEDRKNHMGINLIKKTATCFKCGEPRPGSVLNLIAFLENISTKQAYHLTTKFVDRTLSYLDIPERKRSEGTILLPKEAKKKFPRVHRDYLSGRNFDPDYLIRKYDLYACYQFGPFRYRIIFPVYYQRELVAYVGRDITGQAEMPYKNSPIEYSKIPVKETLYNIDTVKDTAIVVEGPFDAVRLGDGAVATFGTKYTKSQLAMLIGLKRVFIFSDADAENEGEKLSKQVAGFVDHVEVLSSQDIPDPGEMTEQEVLFLKKELRCL